MEVQSFKVESRSLKARFYYFNIVMNFGKRATYSQSQHIEMVQTYV